VIECVEKLSPKFEMQALVHTEFFEERHIPVIDSGTAKEAAPRVAQLTELLRGEQGRIEIRWAVGVVNALAGI
jgi:hypothetical protein